MVMKYSRKTTQMQREETIPDEVEISIQLPGIDSNCAEATGEAKGVLTSAAESFQVMNMELDGEAILNSSLVNNVPRRQRSKRGDMHKKVLDVGNGVEKKTYLHIKANSRPRRKQMCKDIADISDSDSEVIPQRSLHRRGQTRRRGKNSDLGKLDSKTFECYMRKLWRKFPEERIRLSTCLDSLWYNLYTSKTTKAKVLDWISKEDIFSKTYVFVPIIQWSHWSLLIICNMDNNSRSKSRTPCLLLLDSLQGAHAKELEAGIRNFVFDIYSTGERVVTMQIIKKIPFRIPKVPQQKNDADCGYYVLYYINHFLELAPKDFCLSEGYPYSMKEDWFTPEELDCFRKELKSSSNDSDDSSASADSGKTDSPDLHILEESHESPDCCIS